MPSKCFISDEKYDLKSYFEFERISILESEIWQPVFIEKKHYRLSKLKKRKCFNHIHISALLSKLRAEDQLMKLDVTQMQSRKQINKFKRSELLYNQIFLCIQI